MSEAINPGNVTSRSSSEEIHDFFHSPALHGLKLQICDIGRRLWQREYVDGNGGNLAIKVGEDLALCTPTLVSKGFMKPDDLILVDFEGRQIAGGRERTSEILMHLQIMKRQPQAVATVHAHPPYGTAFSVVGVAPPTCLVTEYELFVSLAVAPYHTPGTPELGKHIARLVDKHNTILMANHGVVSWSHETLEDAYFKIEILEAYCRTLLVASQLGRRPNHLEPGQVRDLLRIKQRLGIVDPRHGLKDSHLRDQRQWDHLFPNV